MDTDRTTDRSPIHQFEQLLADAEPEFERIKQASRVAESTAFYDFSFYEFLFPTETGYQGSLSELALATLDEFQIETGADLAVLLLDVLVRVEDVVRDQVRRLRRRDWAEDQVVEDLLGDFYRHRAATLPDVLDAYHVEMGAGRGPHFVEFLGAVTTGYVVSRLYRAYPTFYGFWSEWPVFFDQHLERWRQAMQPPAAPSPGMPTDGDGRDEPPPPGNVEQPTEPGRVAQ